MKESKKVIRAFVLITVWILFITITLSGFLIAGERTENVMTGTVDVKTNSNLSRSSNEQFTMYNVQ